jgi:hypothetical protein
MPDGALLSKTAGTSLPSTENILQQQTDGNGQNMGNSALGIDSDRLLAKHGAIKKREMPVRGVALPKQTSDTNRTRQIARTAAETGLRLTP